MAIERAMTLEQLRDDMRAYEDVGTSLSAADCIRIADAIDAHLRAKPVAYMSQFSLDALEECRHDDVNGSVGAWMRANEELCATIPIYLRPPAQARDARRSFGAVVQRVRDAELFDDGVDADLAANGVTTLADAFLRGRLAACDEIEAAMAREGE